MSRLAEELNGILGEGELSEASEVDIGELSLRKQKELKAIGKALGLHPDMIFDGIHGYVVNMSPSHGSNRFSRAQLAAVLAVKSVRWLEDNGGDVSVGF